MVCIHLPLHNEYNLPGKFLPVAQHVCRVYFQKLGFGHNGGILRLAFFLIEDSFYRPFFYGFFSFSTILNAPGTFASIAHLEQQRKMQMPRKEPKRRSKNECPKAASDKPFQCILSFSNVLVPY